MQHRFVLLILFAACCGCFQPTSSENRFVRRAKYVDIKPTAEQENEIRTLIDELVFVHGNATNEPVISPGIVNDSAEYRERFEKCLAAFDAITEYQEVAFPLLVAHLDDKRHSINFANHYEGNSVGDACYWIMHYQLRDHPDNYSAYGYSRLGRDGKDHPKPYWSGTPFDDAGGLREWILANKELNYTEMQIKCLEWLLAGEKKIGAPDSKSYALNIRPLEIRLLRRRIENAAHEPMTWTLLFFNWLPAAVVFAGLAFWTRNTKGLIFLIAAAVLQMLAVALYQFDWKRLEGQPDQLYVWIVPLGMAVLSVVLIVFAFGRNLLTRSAREIIPEREG